MDFEDWESKEQARGVTFLWPSGSALNATAEGYIDDFSVVSPAADGAIAVLVNP